MQLSTCYQSLSRNRAGLWESLLEGLEGALSLVVLTSMSVSQSDFLHLSWALNDVIKLGKEFCGSESRRLHSCLESKSREYYRQVHGESFHILKEMIDNDTWRSVPVGVRILSYYLPCFPLCLHSLTTYGTSLTIISPSINQSIHHRTQYSHYLLRACRSWGVSWASSPAAPPLLPAAVTVAAVAVTAARGRRGAWG